MRKVLIGLSVAVVAAALLAGAAFAARPNQSWHFVAPLSGAEEVPANDSLGRGVAIFHLSADGESLSYRLIVANIENVTQAHIHAPAPAGADAGVVVWLYPEDGQAPELIPGRFDGVLATGTITEDDLVGAFAGQPLSTLIDAITSGNAYVNVHTTQFPPGEIRGQLD
ncbi:MAG: CHRD domain-containing protein [Candidatus Limnocylindria bacterium]